MINERKLDNIIKNVITEMGKRQQTIGFADGFGPYGRRKDTMHGNWLRWSPEDSGFKSDEPWNRANTYDDTTMDKLLDEAMTAINNAREYAREQGHGEMYMLLNAIIAELSERKSTL